jgi:hypothetical protein
MQKMRLLLEHGDMEHRRDAYSRTPHAGIYAELPGEHAVTPILLECIFSKATTLVDGGWRVSFDCTEEMAEPVMEASRLKGERLYCVVMTEAQFMAQQQDKNR